MTNVHCNLGELEDAVASGTRALEIAGRLDDLRLRILSTSYLVQVHSHTTDYQRVVDLATNNLAVSPPDNGLVPHEHVIIRMVVKKCRE
jgi:hypothetical protein